MGYPQEEEWRRETDCPCKTAGRISEVAEGGREGEGKLGVCKKMAGGGGGGRISVGGRKGGWGGGFCRLAKLIYDMLLNNKPSLFLPSGTTRRGLVPLCAGRTNRWMKEGGRGVEEGEERIAANGS